MKGQFKVSERYAFLQLSDALSKRSAYMLLGVLQGRGLDVDENYLFASVGEQGDGGFRAVYYYRGGARLDVAVTVAGEEATVQWEFTSLLDVLEELRDTLDEVEAQLEYLAGGTGE